MHAIGYAIVAMLIVILIYDQLLFRPLVAWAEKFKAEQVRNGKRSAFMGHSIYYIARVCCVIWAVS